MPLNITSGALAARSFGFASLGYVSVTYLTVAGGGGGGSEGYSGGGGGYAGAATAQDSAGGGGSYIIANATVVATSDGNYNGASTFGGASITNIGTFNANPGYVKITYIG